jgi:hypothetical protein
MEQKELTSEALSVYQRIPCLLVLPPSIIHPTMAVIFLKRILSMAVGKKKLNFLLQ